MKPVKATVVEQTYQMVSAILSEAARDDLIARNPPSGIKLPRKIRKRAVYLTHAQVAVLAPAGANTNHLCCCRLIRDFDGGEATGLRLRDLGLLRNRATVSENVVQVGAKVFVGTTKGSKQRTVNSGSSRPLSSHCRARQAAGTQAAATEASLRLIGCSRAGPRCG